MHERLELIKLIQNVSKVHSKIKDTREFETVDIVLDKLIELNQISNNELFISNAKSLISISKIAHLYSGIKINEVELFPQIEKTLFNLI